MSVETDRARAYLRTTILERVFVSGTCAPIVNVGDYAPREQNWIFDFRAITLESETLRTCATLFSETFASTPVQLCGLESAAIPLSVGIAVHRTRDGSPTNAVFIRKGRKKVGLMRRIEGTLEKGTPIVLVDDICNSGKSFEQQIAVLEAAGYSVAAVWCILSFKDASQYRFAAEKNIAFHSVFSLDEFSPPLALSNQPRRDGGAITAAPFTHAWTYAPGGANHAYVLPKSGLCAGSTHLFYGTDRGLVVALDRASGDVAWTYAVGAGANGKRIFSTPALSPDDTTLYIGAYDGNVYALDATRGARRWINFDAEWIGSSPALASDLGLIFIGTEFGLIRKRGGIAAIDMHTGKTRWRASMPAYTHASPLYISPHRQVVIGSNDGVVRLYDARDGALCWEVATGAATPAEIASGFSSVDIKDACAYDESLDLIVAGNLDGRLVALDRTTGIARWDFKAEFAFWARPLVYRSDTGARVYASSLDKHIYCFDASTGDLMWKRNLGARIFCAPVVAAIGGKDVLLVGSNTGILSAFDPRDGDELWYLPHAERLVNPPVFCEEKCELFVPTAANDVHCYRMRSV